MSSFLILPAKGGVKVGVLPGVDDVSVELTKILKRAKGPSLIGSWTWQKVNITLYGFKEGRKGTETTQEFPAPFDEEILYGDVCVVALVSKKPVNLTHDMWKKFYNSKSGGLDDDEDDDEDDEEEEDEDDEIDYEEEDIDDEIDEDVVNEEIVEEEEEEPVRVAVVRAKPAAMFKKIPKWMYQPDLNPESYPL